MRPVCDVPARGAAARTIRNLKICIEVFGIDLFDATHPLQFSMNLTADLAPLMKDRCMFRGFVKYGRRGWSARQRPRTPRMLKHME
jgi:hypothetical protein